MKKKTMEKETSKQPGNPSSSVENRQAKSGSQAATVVWGSLKNGWN
jgi:hypothetical protein